ncbi:MAG: hypothetical protein M1528_00725 [Candidatus Marsarchaeota archaeon]|jgi:hypothetical protein|nr:hypothetical protein [Candidatus Marsarchaeota archaeon]
MGGTAEKAQKGKRNKIQESKECACGGNCGCENEQGSTIERQSLLEDTGGAGAQPGRKETEGTEAAPTAIKKLFLRVPLPPEVASKLVSMRDIFLESELRLEQNGTMVIIITAEKAADEAPPAILRGKKAADENKEMYR